MPRLNPMIPMPGVTSATIPTEMKSITTLDYRVSSDWLAGFFGFALMVAYWPGIAGAATTARWDVAAMLAIALFLLPRTRMTASHWIGLWLIAWLFASLLWNDGGADGRRDGINACFELAIAGIAFAIGSHLRDMRAILIGAAVGIAINSGFAISQWSGFDGWHGVVQTMDGSFAGLFFNKDRLGAASAMVAVGLVVTPRLWLLLPGVLPALALSGSRAAWLAALAGVLVVITRGVSTRLRGLFVVSALLVIVGYLAWHGIGNSGYERFTIWHDTIVNWNFFGHGLGSFREDFLQMAPTYDFVHYNARPEHPHNELLWLLFEGGVPALLLALGLSCALWRAARYYPERGILVCFFVLGLFAMPLHDPATVVLGALCAGYLAHRHHMVRIVAGDCRSRICPWLAAFDDEGWH